MAAPPDDHPPRGIRLATIGSVPVYLGWSWLLMGGLIVFLVGPSTAQVHGTTVGYSVAVIYALALLLSVLAHEAAHAITARSFGHTVHRVVADLWGGHTAFEASRATPMTSAAIAVVGPLTNAVIAIVCLVASTVLGVGIPAMVLGGIAFVNGALAVLNLLPGLPLDGGQIVEAVVWGITKDQGRARVVAGYPGRGPVIVVVVAVVGVPLLQGRSPSMSTVLWTVLVASFLWSGATQAIRNGRALGTLSGLDVPSLLEPAAGIAHDRPVSELTSLRALPVVVDAAGVPLGLIDHDALRSVPVQAVGSTPVSAVPANAPEGWAVDLTPGREAIELVNAFQSSRSRIVAVSEGGVLRGIVRVERVNAALARN
ncbi:site-2 protease family protein [Janibacter limosus]|uniref:site-2 protease family protein n=2 Tax=Janibacter limosus TaxID=53458 RepID=UPI0035E1032A|nr:site-2 protease family protein [Janibacter limosus]